MPSGRRERSKQDKRERILSAARELLAEHGVGGVTTQQIADQADVAIGSLYLYVSTKAELLIMVQNQKFATAIDDGLTATAATAGHGPIEEVLAFIRRVVACVRQHVENGCTYLRELAFDYPTRTATARRPRTRGPPGGRHCHRARPRMNASRSSRSVLG